MFEVRRYTPQDQAEWDAFVPVARNGLFLFMRGYMDYHADRFHDHSLLIYKDSRLYALLPGNADGDVYCSHQGLTFGGLLTSEKGNAGDTTEAFRAIASYLRKEGFRKVVYKAVPWIYQRMPCEEDLYAMSYLFKPALHARSLSSVINLRNKPQWYRDRRYKRGKALREGIVITESDDWQAFWPILSHNLQEHHHVRPVHTLQEIRLLHDRFPRQIRLFTAMLGHEMLGGTVVYEYGRVAHTQYISASERGKDLHALELLFDELINRRYRDFDYFDFGISTEDEGRILNEGLIFQKEGFGGRGMCYDTYQWEL